MRQAGDYIGVTKSAASNSQAIVKSGKLLVQPVESFFKGLDMFLNAGQIGNTLGDEFGINPRGNLDPDQMYICPTCNEGFTPSDTAEHNNSLGRESGPFKPKENDL